jgi:cell division control protein 6
LLSEGALRGCEQVAFRALAPSEVTAACSTLADMGLLGLGPAREERQRRVTLRISLEDVSLALQDARLLKDCLRTTPGTS